MDANFAHVVDQWHDFYLLAGTGGATLIGLLFVAVSLHVDIITDPHATGVLATARRAFTSFIIILLISLVFLVPEQNNRGLGIPLVALSFSYLGQTVHVLQIIRRDSQALRDLLGTAADERGFGVGLLSSLVLLVLSVTVLVGSTRFLGWFVGALALLLVGAADSCWNLLLDLAVAKRRRDEAETTS